MRNQHQEQHCHKHNANKKLIQPIRAALYDYDQRNLTKAIEQTFHQQAQVYLAYPFENIGNGLDLIANVYEPLKQAIPDLERRDNIVIAGTSSIDKDWIGCCGYYTGTFMNSWLDIPPTGHQVAIRFHEFYEVVDNQVVEMQALWDIPELMMQAKAWPMAPSLGREWQVPSPATQDGLLTTPYHTQHSNQSLQLVADMAAGLANFATGGVEAMQLEKYWHPKFSWYGPSGIGTGRGIAGFRNWHQIPFLNAMPNRTVSSEKGNLFADGDYVAFTAWPGMQATISGNGWMGIAPSNQEITMRSLDFWRCEKGLIRENWVLVDILDIYHQIGVDVLARMREFNKAGFR